MIETVESALRYGKNFLKKKGVESYLIDAQILLMHALGMSKVQLYTKSSERVQKATLEKYASYLRERGDNKPVAYITNQCEFMSLDFYVDANVLIPRPDTEILTEEAIRYIKKKKYKTILEIGTGSGCIAVSISYYIKDLYVMAADISRSALNIARRNAAANDCGRISFINSDLFNSINDKIKVDVIVSNPPYIETGEIVAIPPDVKDYEPRSALDGGENGLDFYINIINEADKYLNEGGMIFFEIGYNQAEAVKKIFNEHGYINAEIIKDLSGRDRVVRAGRGLLPSIQR